MGAGVTFRGTPFRGGGLLGGMGDAARAWIVWGRVRSACSVRANVVSLEDRCRGDKHPEALEGCGVWRPGVFRQALRSVLSLPKGKMPGRQSPNNM